MEDACAAERVLLIVTAVVAGIAAAAVCEVVFFFFCYQPLAVMLQVVSRPSHGIVLNQNQDLFPPVSSLYVYFLFLSVPVYTCKQC